GLVSLAVSGGAFEDAAVVAEVRPNIQDELVIIELLVGHQQTAGTIRALRGEYRLGAGIDQPNAPENLFRGMGAQTAFPPAREILPVEKRAIPFRIRNERK